MKNFALVAGLVALIAVGAWAADTTFDKAPAATNIVETPGTDATVELHWDVLRHSVVHGRRRMGGR
jgi:hypothetical protein